MGKELQQVCVAFCTIQLNFDGKNTDIGIEGRFTHRAGSKTFEWDSDIPHPRKMTPSAASIFSLLGTSIVSAEANRDGTLRLIFSNEHEVTLYDDTPMYEAYQIWNDNDPLVVV